MVALQQYYFCLVFSYIVLRILVGIPVTTPSFEYFQQVLDPSLRSK